MASFHDLAAVCQALGQTQSRLQMAQLVGDFLVRLEPEEAAIAARFIVGRALPQGEEAKLKISGRAVWRIAADLTGSPEQAAEQGEEIFSAAVDFGEAIEMLLTRMRPNDPEPTLTIGEVDRRFAEIAAIEGRQSRPRKLEALRDLLARAGALEVKYIARILIREMRHGVGEAVMVEAIARMASRPVEEVRRAMKLESDLGLVVRAFRGGAPGAGIDAAARMPPPQPKHTRTLDLVIVAADWGYGRRHGWLSNYHLAARDEAGGKFVEVGKTSKGPTDEEFAELTERLLALKIEEGGKTVFVRPELVVEVAYNDIQRSPRYECGMALRLARIARVRDDTAPDEADTIATMADEFERRVVRPLGTKDRF